MRIPRHIYVGAVPQAPAQPQPAGAAAAPANQPPAGGPAVANIVYVGSEQGWLMGPAEGSWWRNFAWWVIPIAALLLAGGWYMMAFRHNPPTLVLPPAPPAVILPAPPAPPAPAATPTPPVAGGLPSTVTVTVDAPGVERAVERLADTLDASAPPAPSGELQAAQQPSDNPCAGLAPRDYRRCRKWYQLP